MLSIPTVGFLRSVNTHNVQLDIFCDWIEASVLYSEDNTISTTDVVDALIEGEVYSSQDLARQMVSNGWRELQRRQGWMGVSSSIEVMGQRIRRTREWKDNAAHSFLIALSLARLYPAWSRTFGSNYTEQGLLFEELTKQALQSLLPGWEIFITGWSRERVNKLSAVVRDVAGKVCEPVGNIERWTRENANEAGLDVVCYYGFRDGKGGYPVYLIQCASGTQWIEKIHTPDLRIWKRIITFTCDPQKAFAIPFALTDSDFVKNCNRINGMLLDRYRLLLPGAANQNWVALDLRNRIITWLDARLPALEWDHE